MLEETGTLIIGDKVGINLIIIRKNNAEIQMIYCPSNPTPPSFGCQTSLKVFCFVLKLSILTV